MRKYRRNAGQFLDALAHSTPLNREQRIKIMTAVEALERRTKRPGSPNGCIGRPGVQIMRALLFKFQNVRNGLCVSSYNAIQAETGLCRASIAAGLRNLEECNVLRIMRRIVRIVNDWGQSICRQGSNVYGFNDSARFVARAIPDGIIKKFERVHAMERNQDTNTFRAPWWWKTASEVGFQVAQAAGAVDWKARTRSAFRF